MLPPWSSPQFSRSEGALHGQLVSRCSEAGNVVPLRQLATQVSDVVFDLLGVGGSYSCTRWQFAVCQGLSVPAHYSQERPSNERLQPVATIKKATMKTFLLGIITGFVLLTLGAMLYLRLGFAEVRADVAPSGWETHLMTAAVRASVQREAQEVRNPVAPTDENLIAGGKMFMNNCAGCHGGIDGAEDNSGTLFPPIPQFHNVGTTYTEAQIFWIAKHGIRRTGMFANGKWYPDKDLWAMVAYVSRIRSLPPTVRQALQSKK